MNKRQKKKRLKKELGRMRIFIDYSNGKDMTAECSYRVANGVVNILSCRLL